jgi:hypothetical protein
MYTDRVVLCVPILSPIIYILPYTIPYHVHITLYYPLSCKYDPIPYNVHLHYPIPYPVHMTLSYPLSFTFYTILSLILYILHYPLTLPPIHSHP